MFNPEFSTTIIFWNFFLGPKKIEIYLFNPEFATTIIFWKDNCLRNFSTVADLIFGFLIIWDLLEVSIFADVALTLNQQHELLASGQRVSQCHSTYYPAFRLSLAMVAGVCKCRMLTWLQWGSNGKLHWNSSFLDLDSSSR